MKLLQTNFGNYFSLAVRLKLDIILKFRNCDEHNNKVAQWETTAIKQAELTAFFLTIGKIMFGRRFDLG